MKLTQAQIGGLKKGQEVLLKCDSPFLTRRSELVNLEIKNWGDHETCHIDIGDGRDYYFLVTAEKMKCPMLFDQKDPQHIFFLHVEG